MVIHRLLHITAVLINLAGPFPVPGFSPHRGPRSRFCKEREHNADRCRPPASVMAWFVFWADGMRDELLNSLPMPGKSRASFQFAPPWYFPLREIRIAKNTTPSPAGRTPVRKTSSPPVRLIMLHPVFKQVPERFRIFRNPPSRVMGAGQGRTPRKPGYFPDILYVAQVPGEIIDITPMDIGRPLGL